LALPLPWPESIPCCKFDKHSVNLNKLKKTLFKIGKVLICSATSQASVRISEISIEVCQENQE
jgi:hypothetical protein